MKAMDIGVGRPSVVTEEVVGKLRQGFLMGFTDEEACKYAQIHRDTLYEYQHKNPEFSDKKEAWKLNPILKAKVIIYKNLKDFKVAQWYLERKCRSEFSLRHELVEENKIQAVIDRLESDSVDDVAEMAKKELEKEALSNPTQS